MHYLCIQHIQWNVIYIQTQTIILLCYSMCCCAPIFHSQSCHQNVCECHKKKYGMCQLARTEAGIPSSHLKQYTLRSGCVWSSGSSVSRVPQERSQTSYYVFENSSCRSSLLWRSRVGGRGGNISMHGKYDYYYNIALYVVCVPAGKYRILSMLSQSLWFAS